MAKLPRDLSGRDVRVAFEKDGFIFRRQPGSHIVPRRDDHLPASLPPIIEPFAWELCAKSLPMRV